MIKRIYLRQDKLNKWRGEVDIRFRFRFRVSVSDIKGLTFGTFLENILD
jgi:hypothetical protein